MAASTGRSSHRAPPSLKEIIYKIRTRSSAAVEDGLREIQILVRSSKGLGIVRNFRELGGLDEVVKVVKSNTGDENFIDVALSVLATCCREQETKTRVDELEGISAVVDVLKAHSSVSIINRASRALANLAELPKLSSAIHRKGAIPLLVRSLKEHTDSNCRQSILRTVRILADTSQHTWEILQSEGLSVVLRCLESDDVKLVGCAAHTAAVLTNNLGSGQSTEALRAYREAGRQAVEDNGVGHLVGLLSHSKPAIQEHALMALLNLMVSEGVRVAAGRAGGVEVFIERGKATAFAGWATYIHCLCFCCREAVNRVRVRDLEGLQVLLNILKSSDEDCVRLHETVLVALMDFYYDEQSLNYLATCGFIEVLVSQLRQEESHSVIDSVGSSSKSEKDGSRQPELVDARPSTTTSTSKGGKSPTKSLPSSKRKRMQISGEEAEKTHLGEAEQSVRKHARYSLSLTPGSSKSPTLSNTQSIKTAVHSLLRDESQHKAPVLSSVTSSKDQVTQIAEMKQHPESDRDSSSLSKTHSIKTPVQSVSQDKSSHKVLVPSSVMSSKDQVTGSPETKQQSESDLPSHPLSAPAMSPETRVTDYHSYLNLEATPYSPPRIDWEWFLQRREQMGQELSPRSFSSFSSPPSLSPPRYDFSPLSSPQWSPQWSPQHSPQHIPQWSSPQYSAEWSSQQGPQWSPQHSPQWDDQSSPDRDGCPSPPVQDNETAVTKSSSQTTLRDMSSTSQMAEDGTPVQLGVPDAVIVRLSKSLESTSDKVSPDLSERTLSKDKDSDTSCCKPTKAIKPGKGAIVQRSTLKAVCELSLNDDDDVELSSSRHSAECQQSGKVLEPVCSPSKIQDGHSSMPSPSKNVQSDSSSGTRLKPGKFREPRSKSLKMRTGKSKTTTVCRQTLKDPCPSELELDTDLVPITESGEQREMSGASKFERDMEIRRAKEQGKLRKREYAVITLLSRYSHMDDPSTHMARESVISVLLDYRPSSAYLQSKCERTLHRILRNRLCFEQLILEHVPMLIARKMLERQHKAKQTDTVDDGSKLREHRGRSPMRRSQSIDDVRSLKSRASSSDDRTLEGTSPQPVTGQKQTRIVRSQSVTTEPDVHSSDALITSADQPKGAASTSWHLEADTMADLVDDVTSDTASVSSMDTVESEQYQLWGDTASPLYPLMVSTCQYRQGLMLGLLLSNSFKGKIACVLAVPYICQSNSLKRKLLIKHKGLWLLLDYLQKGSIDPYMFVKAVRCLRDLSSALFSDANLLASGNVERVRFLRSPGEHVCLDRELVGGEKVLATNVRKEIREGKERELRLKAEVATEESHQWSDHQVDVSKEEVLCTSSHGGAGGSSSKVDAGSLIDTLAEDVGTLSAEALTSTESSSGSRPSSKGQMASDTSHASSHCPLDHLVMSELISQEDILSKTKTCCYNAVQQHADVNFLLDQEVVVKAHRDILVKASKYFACLLEGPYWESGQSTVPLREVSKEVLVIILHALYGCLHTRCCQMRDALASGCDTVMESVACAGRFLLWPVQNQLCDILVDNYMDATTVVSHFEFGLKHSCSKLTSACLMYILTSNQVAPKHFQDLVERGCAKDAFKTIEKMITDALFSVT